MTCQDVTHRAGIRTQPRLVRGLMVLTLAGWLGGQLVESAVAA